VQFGVHIRFARDLIELRTRRSAEADLPPLPAGEGRGEGRYCIL